uniref:Ubiquitin-fusion protein n=1 Tax=Tetraselmis sp. GSL018 TaxID=582737 RepID=A0A061RHR7_9CHLO|mmetsp:Transcript_12992/g.30826  ORF Transcript_12992/g.30826 Transcript_12992/m.30826 type:complete len:123 (-) Transcript_12992:119-487(-)
MPAHNGETVSIRFRHTTGDIGPFSFSPSATILSLKERVCQEWPNCSAQVPDTEVPKSPASLKLIFNGKFLEDNKVLSEFETILAEQSVTTFHLVIRPAGASKPGAKSAETEAMGKRCGCAIQ